MINMQVSTLFCGSGIQIQLRRWAGHVACIGVKRNTYRIFVEKSERTRPLARSSHRCEIIFKWILKKLNVRMRTRFN
jgi:hypothetical protein